MDRYVNFTARLTGTARYERRHFCEANCLNVRKSQRDNFKKGRVDCAESLYEKSIRLTKLDLAARTSKTILRLVIFTYKEFEAVEDE